MEYQIKQLEKTDLIKYIDSYIETLQNLSKVWELDLEKTINTLEKIENQQTKIYVAINQEKWIIWSISLLLEQKFFRWWWLAAHIEDVVIRKWFEWLGIWNKLIQQAISTAKSQNCYKIILDCDQSLSKYYQKFWFENSWTFMRIYL